MTDTPKWYLAEPFMLGTDVLDGREGRWRSDGVWVPAEECRSGWPHTIFETRPVPERMVAIDLPESVVRAYATQSWYDTSCGEVTAACRSALEREAAP